MTERSHFLCFFCFVSGLLVSGTFASEVFASEPLVSEAFISRISHTPIICIRNIRIRIVSPGAVYAPIGRLFLRVGRIGPVSHVNPTGRINPAEHVAFTGRFAPAGRVTPADVPPASPPSLFRWDGTPQ